MHRIALVLSAFLAPLSWTLGCRRNDGIVFEHNLSLSASAVVHAGVRACVCTRACMLFVHVVCIIVCVSISLYVFMLACVRMFVHVCDCVYFESLPQPSGRVGDAAAIRARV